MSPIQLEADLAIPGIGIVLKTARVVDAAIEGRIGRQVETAADAELPPAAAEVRGERYEARSRGKGRRRLSEKFVPQVRAQPDSGLPVAVPCVARDCPASRQTPSDPAGERIEIAVANVGDPVIELVD